MKDEIKGHFGFYISWLVLALALVAVLVSRFHWIALTVAAVVAIYVILERLFPEVLVKPLPTFTFRIDERHIGVFIITVIVLLCWWAI